MKLDTYFQIKPRLWCGCDRNYIILLIDPAGSLKKILV